MTEFTLLWLNGKAELAYGNDINEVLNKVKRVGKVVYYTEGNAIENYEFDKEQKRWLPKGNVKYNLDFFPLEVKNEGKDKDGNTIRSFFIDDTGRNKLMVKQNDKLITLILKLGTTKNRHIGTVTKSTRTIEMRRQEGKHLLIKINGYGFNHYVLKNQNSIDFVRLSDDRGRYWKLKVKDILKHGKFMYFKNQGYELQQFLSLEELDRLSIPLEKNSRF